MVKTNNRPINVDWWGRSLLFGPAKHHEWNLFACVNSRTIEHMVSLTSRRMILTALSKLRGKHSRACSSPRIATTWWTSTWCLLRKNRCSATCNLSETLSQRSLYAEEHLFMRASRILRDAALLIRLNLCCFYHIPCNIAVITLLYHTEVDKLNWR